MKEFGFDGIIAKRKDSCYESGKRRGAWLKYKVNKAQAFVIGWVHARQPAGRTDRRLLSTREADVRQQGAQWFRVALAA